MRIKVAFNSRSLLKEGETTDKDGFSPFRLDLMQYGCSAEFGKIVDLKEIGMQGLCFRKMVVNLRIMVDREGNEYIIKAYNEALE